MEFTYMLQLRVPCCTVSPPSAKAVVTPGEISSVSTVPRAISPRPTRLRILTPEVVLAADYLRPRALCPLIAPPSPFRNNANSGLGRIFHTGTADPGGRADAVRPPAQSGLDHVDRLRLAARCNQRPALLLRVPVLRGLRPAGLHAHHAERLVRDPAHHDAARWF